MIARPDFVFQGHFGVVYRGTFTPMGTACSLEVAIKTIQQSQNKDELAGQEEDLIKEAKIMARANGFLKDQKTFHDNIVNLQGMVFQVVKKISTEIKVFIFDMNGSTKVFITSNHRGPSDPSAFCFSPSLPVSHFQGEGFTWSWSTALKGTSNPI